MKRAFQVLKGEPTVTIRLTRDSVCAGDDCDAPHEEHREVHSFIDPEVLASHLASGYLPSVSGVGHVWDCVLNGNLIARVKIDSIQVKTSKVEYSEANHMHFKYHSACY